MCVCTLIVIHVAAIITPTPGHPWRTPTTPFMSMCVCVRATEADGSLYYYINYIIVTLAVLFNKRTMHELIYTIITLVTALEPAKVLQHPHWHGVTDAQYRRLVVACFQTSLNLVFCSFFFSLRNSSAFSAKTSDRRPASD